ncbi:hypothetical protein PFISCL1PPCAC_10986, partial [Pristionchus fissidentatus]
LSQMSIFRKKSTNSQSSFVVLDESQGSIKPKSACSIGCDPIFEWKETSETSTGCDISIPIDEDDLNMSINEMADKENQLRRFWKRAVAARRKLRDDLNDSTDELSFTTSEKAEETQQVQAKWDRLYSAAQKAIKEREDGEETEERVTEREEEEEESGEDEEEVDEDEEYSEDEVYQRLDDSDDQESE